MVQNFALAAIVALFATATFASSDATVKKEEPTAEAGKDAAEGKKAEEDKKEEAKK
jgi:ribosomal protein L12E/L44/L45/RPP1/RPP2